MTIKSFSLSEYPVEPSKRGLSKRQSLPVLKIHQEQEKNLILFSNFTHLSYHGNNPHKLYNCIGKENNCIGCKEGLVLKEKIYVLVFDLADKTFKVYSPPSVVVRKLKEEFEGNPRYKTVTTHLQAQISFRGRGPQTRYKAILLPAHMHEPLTGNYLQQGNEIMSTLKWQEWHGIKNYPASLSKRDELLASLPAMDDEDEDYFSPE